MPLVERYNDWNTRDGSYDDPHTLSFDHRLEASSAADEVLEGKDGLADVENNSQATCLITSLEPDYGWVDAGDGDWIYDPDALPDRMRPTLAAHFDRNLGSCVEQDRDSLLVALTHDSSDEITNDMLSKALATLTWPECGHDSRGKTAFVSRFPLSDQYIAGPHWSSGYHLGGGLVGTAGHCLLRPLLTNELSALKVIFGWSGDVRGKRFTASQAFSIDRVILCDAPGEYHDPSNPSDIASWARRWDDAIFQLKGISAQFDILENVRLATGPPRFGTRVYNSGHPLGTSNKISWKSHVLRHAIFNHEPSAFCHTIQLQGSYTTDLDQFPGNSGGPVVDATTGKVIGHTSSTQSAVAEASIQDIEQWEDEYLNGSKNYNTVASVINPLLARTKPSEPTCKVHSKFMRTLSGSPSGGALFLNTTFICPGDLGPNKVLQPENTYQAVFNRHRWASLDVVFRNLTARIDRICIFTKSMDLIISEYPGSTLVIKLIGKKGELREPCAGSSVKIIAGESTVNIQLGSAMKPCYQSADKIFYSYSIDLASMASKDNFLPDYHQSPSIADWTDLRLEQATDNPPDLIGLEVLVRRAPFPFPVDKRWPKNRPDVTDNPADYHLEWPAEDFRFSTAVGFNVGASQINDNHHPTPSVTEDSGSFRWTAPIDRVWTNPAQPTSGFQAAPELALLDPLMSDFNVLVHRI